MKWVPMLKPLVVAVVALGLTVPEPQLPGDRPAANPRALEDAQAFMRSVAGIEIDRCPHCKTGHWLVVDQVPADPAALAAIVPTACRGPP